MTELVSILTPSFNQARWLVDNLRSVANQTYPSIEHIVMDGGSTDGSVDVLAQADPAVQWCSEPDRGQSHALNKAFTASRGEIIGWLNSDDAYVDRRAIESAVAAFRAHPDVGVVYGHGLLVNRSNRVLQFLWAPPFHPRLFRFGSFFIQPSVFIRRSFLCEPFVDERLHYIMDWDLWRRLMDRTRFHRIDTIVALDRHQPARKTLMAGYPQERADYDRARGIDPNSRRRLALAKTAKVAVRLVGTPRAAMLPHLVKPAIDLDMGSTPTRVAFQTVYERKRMPID
ncbi:MAG: hypothetical protein QOJ59_1922 [Thermomicrobiales bacterium]|jgi:glycosyltransferase involved in cell wall biosynthesis|nr:hypothetical protein [Thermomicrobiales bacterium]